MSDPFAPAPTDPARLRRLRDPRYLRVALSARVWQGAVRVRASAWPILQASVAAGIAYLIGKHLLGHEAPFFAAFAAWACLGFAFDRSARKVGEIAAGVALGVTLGDLVVHTIGSGAWQIALVLCASALLARFIDRGPIIVSQAGAQAIVIAGAPNLTGGPYGRAVDAVVGGLVALVFTLLLPGDPRRALRQLLATAAEALAATARLIGEALDAGDAELARHALARARLTDPALREAVDQTRVALEQAHYTVNRRNFEDLDATHRQAVLLDQAMRSTRVLARRVRFDLVLIQPTERAILARLLGRYARGMREFANAQTTGQDPAAARVTLSGLVRETDPAGGGLNTPAGGGLNTEALALLLLLRAAVVDAALAAGGDPLPPRD